MTSEAQSHFSRLQKEIFSVNGQSDFERLALEVFQLQVIHVPIYKNYAEHLNVVPSNVTKFVDIPFLPIEFFKSHEVMVDGVDAELEFLSSGTTGQQSRHFVASTDLYRQSLLKGFTHRWGAVKDFCLLCLLPSYLERGNSSLVWMCNELVGLSKQKESGFYLDQLEELAETIRDLERRKIPTILFGVTFALLDLANLLKIELKTTSIIETGGMKGKGKELTRLELHDRLQDSFGSQPIQSEYGMTELLSQAYTDEKGLFRCPPWMRISIRDVRDPFALAASGKTGGVNVVDLANLYSCSFISTRDLGRMHDAGSFEIMGRFDNSDLRGCSLMIVD